MRKKKAPEKPNDPISSTPAPDPVTLGLLHNFIMYAGFTALRMSIAKESSSPEEAKELFNRIVDSWALVTKSNITMEFEKIHSDSQNPFQQLLAQMLDSMGEQKQDVEDLHVEHIKAVNLVADKVKEMVKWEEDGSGDEFRGL